MQKRWTRGPLIAIAIALAGLLLVQVKWMRDTARLREELFELGVQNALFTVSERLEREEKLRDLAQHELGRELLPLAQQAMDPGAGRTGPPPTTAQGSELPPDLLAPLGRQDQEVLIADMVRNLLGRGGSRSVRERIDPILLDSLLRSELASLAPWEGVAYGVYSSGGTLLLLPTGPGVDTSGLAASPFRERLFRNDLLGDPAFLHVVMPGRSSSVLEGLLPLLITSVVFILVIVLAFLLAIRIILRQKRLNDIRNDLVNNLTHELKTPISTIALACEALSDPTMPKSEQQVRTYTTMIRDENKRLGQLVENVLMSAVLDSGHMVVKRVELDLHALLRDVVASSSMLVERRGGRIELDLGADIHRLQGDRIHLTNLFYNLVDNAVKYCEQAPRIRIATRCNDEGITVSVSDNGIGIAASERSKVFDRLYRVPTGNVHNVKGFGLGLSYVRTVVERHQGRIRLESTPGKGSTFHIHLPYEHDRTN